MDFNYAGKYNLNELRHLDVISDGKQRPAILLIHYARQLKLKDEVTNRVREVDRYLFLNMATIDDVKEPPIRLLYSPVGMGH